MNSKKKKNPIIAIILIAFICFLLVCFSFILWSAVSGDKSVPMQFLKFFIEIKEIFLTVMNGFNEWFFNLFGQLGLDLNFVDSGW